jgi:hypothetical protein
VANTIVTVTKSPDPPRCGWCHRPFDQLPGAGRPRMFCSRSHRQRAYEARRRADSLKIPVGQVIVSEADLQSLHDRLYRLESAVEDVRTDLGGSPGPKAYKEAFEHLYDSAQDLVGVVVEPVRE